MATNKNRNLSNPPPKKKSKPANKMNVDNRDSLSEFQSSIFDASDGHQLVDFIRKKKGLRAQPQKIFDDVPANRQSLHIEIQRLDIHEHNATHAKETNSQPAEEEIQNQASNENNTRSSVLESPTRQSIRSPTHSKTLMKRLSQSIGRRTLLKEFEKTLQESRFLPPTCSTPVIGDVPPNRTSTMKEKIETVSQGNLNIVCTPITITDEDSSKRENRSKQTADMAEDLQDQVEFVLDRNSKENLLINEACEDSVDDAQDNQHSITLRNRILTPLKAKNRQTFTIERDSVSGNLILSPSKSVARTADVHSHPQTPERRSNARNIILSPSTSVGRTANMHSHSPTPERSSNARNLMLSPSTSTGRTTARYSHPKTPERSLNASRNTKLIVTPKQKQLLLSKFGRSSQGMPSPQKAPSPPRSRIPVFLHGNNAATHAAPEPDPYVESANLSQQHPETVKIIEQLQRQNTSNVPVIVIPVNQTFNQAPNPEPVSSATFVQSPRPLEPAPRASPAKLKSPPPPPSVSSSSSSGESTPVKMNSLRLKDIITDDESSDYHPNFSQSRKIIRRKVKKSSNSSHSRSGVRLSNRPENKLSLTAKPPLNLSKVRQVVKSHQLSRMSDHEILDLRKRNSRGELRQSLKLTQRESSLLGKQMELELLRRNIQARNYEDEVLQMEVLAAPPDEFCDISVQRSKAADPPHQFNDEFVDEMSGDKVSLTQQERYSKSLGGQKPVRKKKKVSEHVERYLETSQKIQKSKYMNLSKRKLYSKGDSEEGSSTECLPLQKPSPPRQPIKRRSSQRKSNNVPSTPPAPPPSTSPPSPSTSPPLPSISPPPPSPTQPTNSPSPQRISMSSHQISNESVKKSVQSEQFLPQNNEVSQKPVKKTKKYQKKAKKPLSPVDPDRGTSFVSVNNQENMCRRSKREKKLPMAYWSSTQTEFRPLYDYNDVVKKVPKKLTKKTPITEMHLVANTKKVKSNRVAESAKNVKKSTKGHDQQEKSRQSKESEDDVSRERRETPATVLDKQQTTHHVNRRGRPQKKNSKKNNRTAERSDETRFTTSNIVDDPCPNVTLPYTESEKVLLENETTVSNEETSRTMRNHSRELMVKLNPLSKSILSPSIQGSSGYSSDVSSVQQIRLATIDEDSVPTVQQTNINSTMASSNENRLSRELMPPPPSTEFIRSKKSAGKVKNSKKSAFRTEHDQSIADVSSDHLNKLFDQLKNSSVCPSSDVTASLNHNNSGQATAHSRPAESNSILQRKCKNIAILLPRMKVKKPPAHRSEKVCDSGFSSEDMSSVPKQKGDVLLNWLKQMIVNSKSTSGADKGVAKILQADGFHTSSVEDLIFQEVDGVEYAFYDTKQPFSIGYIRFNPKTGKKKCTAKKFELNFVILSGKVNITVNDTKFDCKNGDLITVFIGTSYVIQNISNDPALVMVIKKQCLVN